VNKSRLVIFLGFPLIFLLIVGSFPLKKTIEGVCSRVLDGDTVIVKGQKIRLYGIDAPEKDQYSIDGYPIGQWSKDYLTKLILNKKVKVTYYKRGYYGRIIGEIFDHENINLKMVKKGMAIVSDFTHEHLYTNTEFVARLNRVGIFGVSGFLKPSFYRKLKK